MSFKRRSAAAASPDVRSRTKRQKVSEDDLVDETSSRVSLTEKSEESEAPESQDDSEFGFEGDSLQTAQDKIMSELTKLRDADGQEVAYPFIGKPDRTLYRDYYELIQHPVSLRSIQKKVRGTDSRKNLSKTTAYPTWQSFEEEVSYIWRNAREYNEDDSEISALAGILENYFWRRVEEAKKWVPNPQIDGAPETPRIKLKMSTTVPPIAGGSTVRVVDQSSGAMSKVDGQSSDILAKHEPPGPRREVSLAGAASQEASDSPRKHLNRSRPNVTTMCASEPSERSLLPNSAKNEPSASMSMSQDYPHAALGASAGITQNYPLSNASVHHLSNPSPMDSLLRRPDHQDASLALIRNIEVQTHASLSLSSDFCLDIPPSSLLSQQNITIHLPPSHSLLTLRPRLAASTGQRQVKMVALTGTQRLHSSGDATMPEYDIRLHPGMTRVDLEAIAGPVKGVTRSGPPGSDVEYERVTVFLNLLQ